MVDRTVVAVDALATYAGARFQDSYLYHGLCGYLADLERIPRQAWGELPWSDTWRRGWALACGYRIDEARTCRDKAAEIGGKLLQVAADYRDADADWRVKP